MNGDKSEQERLQKIEADFHAKRRSQGFENAYGFNGASCG